PRPRSDRRDPGDTGDGSPHPAGATAPLGRPRRRADRRHPRAAGPGTAQRLGARFRVSLAVVAVPPLGASRRVTVAWARFASSFLPFRFSLTGTVPLAPAASL